MSLKKYLNSLKPDIFKPKTSKYEEVMSYLQENHHEEKILYTLRAEGWFYEYMLVEKYVILACKILSSTNYTKALAIMAKFIAAKPSQGIGFGTPYSTCFADNYVRKDHVDLAERVIFDNSVLGFFRHGVYISDRERIRTGDTPKISDYDLSRSKNREYDDVNRFLDIE